MNPVALWWKDLQFNDGDLAATITCGLYTQGVTYTIGLTINISPSVEGASGPTRDELKAMDWSSIKQFCSDYMTNTPFSNGGMTWSPEGGGKSYYIGGRKEKNFAGGYTEEPIAVHHSCEI